MYSSQNDTYQLDVRNAFEKVMIEHGVDMYLAGEALLDGASVQAV